MLPFCRSTKLFPCAQEPKTWSNIFLMTLVVITLVQENWGKSPRDGLVWRLVFRATQLSTSLITARKRDVITPVLQCCRAELTFSTG